MLDTGGVPVADYRGEVVVSACGAAGCFVKFSCECSPVGLTDAEWRDMWMGMQVASGSFIRGRVAPGLSTASPPEATDDGRVSGRALRYWFGGVSAAASQRRSSGCTRFN
jgi:hypothetical protein